MLLKMGNKVKLLICLILMSSILSGCSSEGIKETVVISSQLSAFKLYVYYGYILCKPVIRVVGVVSEILGVVIVVSFKRSPSIKKVGVFGFMILLPLICFFIYYGMAILITSWL